jgi:hypothetical protein
MSSSIIAAQVTSEPMLVTLVEAQQTYITIAWNPPLVLNGSPVVGYKVYIDGGYEGTTTGLVWSATSVTTGNQYAFTVSALNGRGESSQSLPISIYAATISSVPLNARNLTADISSVTLQWDSPASNGGTPITDYQVFWDLGAQNDEYQLLASSTGNFLSFTKSDNIITGGYYSFKVTAVNAVGISAQSNVAVIIAATLPSAPRVPYEY